MKRNSLFFAFLLCATVNIAAASNPFQSSDLDTRVKINLKQNLGKTFEEGQVMVNLMRPALPGVTIEKNDQEEFETLFIVPTGSKITIIQQGEHFLPRFDAIQPRQLNHLDGNDKSHPQTVSDKPSADELAAIEPEKPEKCTSKLDPLRKQYAEIAFSLLKGNQEAQAKIVSVEKGFKLLESNIAKEDMFQRLYANVSGKIEELRSLSLETDIFASKPVFKIAQSPMDAVFDKDDYVQMRAYSFIQPDFVADVLTGPQKEVLEICAGQGFVLEAILKQKNAKSSAPDVHYTVVEQSSSNMALLKAKWEQHTNGTKGNILGCAQKDVVEFLSTNVEKKRGKYQAVFAGFALHVLKAQAFVDTLDGLYTVMAEGGKLYITQHCVVNGEYSQGYKDNVRRGALLPFWVGGSFYSDPKTMTKLLNNFGFIVSTCDLYQEIHPNGTCTRYLGMIAQKNSKSRKEALLKDYQTAAQQFNAMSRQPMTFAAHTNGCVVREMSIGAKNKCAIHDPKCDKEGQFNALTVEFNVDSSGKAIEITTMTFDPKNKIGRRAVYALLTKLLELHRDVACVRVLAALDETDEWVMTDMIGFSKKGKALEMASPALKDALRAAQTNAPFVFGRK